MELQLSIKSIRESLKALGDNSWKLDVAEYAIKGKPSTDLKHVNFDSSLGLEELKLIQGIMKANGDSEVRKISSLVNSLGDPENRKLARLEDLPQMFKAYMAKLPNQWLFSANAGSKSVAFLVQAVRYCTPRDSYREKPYVEINLVYNSELKFRETRFLINSTEVGLTIPKILQEKGYLPSTDELVESYEKHHKKYKDTVSRQGDQFRVRGEANIVSDSGYWWTSKQVNLTHSGKATKAVLDMESLRDSSRVDASSLLCDQPVPTHPVLRFFSLKYHQLVWVNVVDFRDYKYENLMDRLVLPKTHSRLIGALVSNLDALRVENEAEDRSAVIRSKASASVIICVGPAGCGKTLTAEVYAEEIRRPLYEISGGQLGSEPQEIEENLADVLDRSTRLRMPIVINEADIFIRQRSNDFKQNAIVAVFLRLLEYHNGLIFLTTNKSDIDDAILSRALAEIHYTRPGPVERKRIWASLLAEFNVEMTEDDINKVVKLFPEASGRDIQNLIRLTTRTCAALNESFSVQSLKDNSTFRGMRIAD